MVDTNKSLMVETITKIPKLSFVLVFAGLLYLLISIIQFGFQFYDKSQLISNIAIGCSIFVISYIYWYFKNNDRKIDEMHKDFQSFDKKINDLEVTFIKFRNEEEDK